MQTSTVETCEYHSSDNSSGSSVSNMVTHNPEVDNDTPEVDLPDSPRVQRVRVRKQPGRVRTSRKRWRKLIRRSVHNRLIDRKNEMAKRKSAQRARIEEMTAKVLECRALASKISAEASLYQSKAFLIQAETMRVMMHTFHVVIENVQRVIAHRTSIN